MELDTDRLTSPRRVQDQHQAQALASRRLGFSVTKACPLRCAHCSVSAAPDLKHTTYTSTFTDKVVAEMPELARAGITCIDFTGGEPTLAPDFIHRVSEAAAAQGMSVGIVSAAHWATSAAQAHRFIERFPCVTHWDISTDIYHLPFVPIERVRLAFEALSAQGRPPMVRVAHHEPLSYPEAELIASIHRFAGERMGFQPIGPVGRAETLVQAQPATRASFDRSPCPTTGLLIQTDGRGAPCCAPLSHEESDHPLRSGNAFTERLVTLVQRWRVNPLLQTIRLCGFEPVVAWLDEEPALTRQLRTRHCDLCVSMARTGRLLHVAAERAARLEHRIQLAQALKTWFDEPWMEAQLVAEAKARYPGGVSCA